MQYQMFLNLREIGKVTCNLGRMIKYFIVFLMLKYTFFFLMLNLKCIF